MRILIAPYAREALPATPWPAPPGHEVDLLVVTGDPEVAECRVGTSTLAGQRLTTIAVPPHRVHGDRRKLVYHYAVQHGYEVLVEAAGPESALSAAIERFVEAHRADGLQALFGVIAPRIAAPLTFSRQAMAWRIYAVAALAELPFEFNIWGYGFDMEVYLQLRAEGHPLRLERVPADAAKPPHHFGLGYVAAQFMPWLRYRLHRLGIVYQLQYDLHPQRQEYTLKSGYVSSHEMAVNAVAPDTTVVDLGAGAECYLAPSLKAKGCRVYAADIRPIQSDLIEEAYRLDLNFDPLPECCRHTDHILLLDIIEHLYDPESFLLRLRHRIASGRTTVVITTPNIAFGITRLMLLIGQFNYGKSGILDRTHCRLFTFRSMRRILRQCGYRIVDLDGVPAPFPKAIGDNALARLLVTLNRLGIRLCKSLFSYQIFVVVRADPPLASILGNRPEANLPPIPSRST